jgi:lysophospholipase L1-like esterase
VIIPSPAVSATRVAAPRILRGLAIVCLGIGSATAGEAAPAAEAPAIQTAAPLGERMTARSLVGHGDTQRLQAVFAKARRGEPIVVAAIGGSITAGGAATKQAESRYVDQVAGWFRERFPACTVRAVNAGVGATNSMYGAARVQPDVLAHDPDLVIVEFAVNDFDNREFAESYEGILRQILAARPETAVMCLFFMHGRGENAQTWQQMLGRHYGLPMVSFRDAMWPEFSAGRLTWRDYYADEVHPNDTGHIAAATLLRRLLAEHLDAPKPAVPAATTSLPPPLISDRYQRCLLTQADDLTPAKAEGWRLVNNRTWECGPAGGELLLTMPGEIILMNRTIPKEAEAAVFFSVDGSELKPISADPHNRPLVSDLAPSRHAITIVVKPYATDKQGDGLPVVKIHSIGAAGVASEPSVVNE